MAVKVNLIAHLGPRMIWADDQLMGTTDDVSFTIAEATPEELKKFLTAREIRLTKGGDGHENPGGIDQVSKKV